MQESNFYVKESCLCPGDTVHNLTYECTTVGHGTTVWRGTAFNCSAVGNEIALRHSRFTAPDGASNQCNNGNITGRSLRREGKRYTSQIHIIFTPDLLGRTVECVHDNLTSYELIGNSIIVNVTGIKFLANYYHYFIFNLCFPILHDMGITISYLWIIQRHGIDNMHEL